MANNHQPLVSILTPSYNQGKWLQENLVSVQNQTYTNIEHIVMDGGSTDSTLDILRDAAANVSWVSEPDRGQSHALNKAFGVSTGDIIGWINSDDAFVDRRAVEAVVQAFHESPDIGVVYGHGVFVDEATRFLRVVWHSKHKSWMLDGGSPLLQPTVFFRRSAIPLPFLREELHYTMDWDLFLRMRENGVKFHRIPIVIGLDRLQPDRKSFDYVAMNNDKRQLLNEYDIEFGRRQRIHRKLWTIGKILAGTRLAANLPSSVDPAIGIDFLPSRERILNQTVRRMRNIYGEVSG